MTGDRYRVSVVRKRGPWWLLRRFRYYIAEVRKSDGAALVYPPKGFATAQEAIDHRLGQEHAFTVETLEKVADRMVGQEGVAA